VSPEKSPPPSVLYYDRVAHMYAGWYEARSPGGYALHTRRQRVLELLEGTSGRVLDVGCGPGVLVPDLLHRGHEVWGLDASASMIAECRRRFAVADRAHFTIGDAASLPFGDGFFDAVICTGVIERLLDDVAALREMARVLKQGGALLVSFPNGQSPYALWRRFVFYPLVAFLQKVSALRAPQPRLPSLLSATARLYTVPAVAVLLARQGVDVIDVVHFYFNVFLSPLDEMLPRLAARVIHRLEPQRRGRLRWLGAGFIVKGRKR